MIATLLLTTAKANFWEKLVAFACNTGCADYSETWNGTTKQITPNCLCPPYNKQKGRKGCILQYDFPSGGWYAKFCAEESTSSSYFTPKINIKMQSCNLFDCWMEDFDLNSNGQCKILAGPYGIPTYRFCARIAQGLIPPDPDNSDDQGIGADDGYTPGMHLNTEGLVVADDDKYKVLDDNGNPVLDTDGKVTYTVRPKLCAYKDPWVLSFGLDLMDYKPNSQPIHANSGRTSAFISFLIGLSNLGADISEYLIAGWWGGMGPDDDDGDWVKNLSDGIINVMEYIQDPFIWLLKEIGDMNRVVDQSLGCVELPTGPLPPPYPKMMNEEYKNIAMPLAQQICPTDENGTIYQTVPYDDKNAALNIIDSNGCVLSPEPNNFINNSIRVGFNNIIPLCTTLSAIDNDTYKSIQESTEPTDKCVQIKGVEGLDINLLRLATHDALPPCGQKSGPCYITNNTLCESVGGCLDNVRVVYGLKMDEIVPTPNIAYNPNKPFCNTLNSDNQAVTKDCQFVWGLNFGAYKDLTVKFDTIDNSKDQEISTTEEVTYNNNTYSIKALISKSLDIGSATNVNQTNQICLFDMKTSDKPRLINCFNRPLTPKPSVYDCASPAALSSGAQCNSTYFNPAMYVEFKAAAPKFTNNVQEYYSTGGVVHTAVYQGNTSYDADDYKAIIAGQDYTSYATDNTFQQSPFFGPHGIRSGTSIYGNYKNDDLNSTYIDGIEYIDNQYLRGGVRVCLQDYNYQGCPNDVTQCVLTKYQYAKDLPCTEVLNFIGVDSLCTDDNKKFPVLTSQMFNNVTISKHQDSASQATCYSHDYQENGQLVNWPLCIASMYIDDRILPQTISQTLDDKTYFDVYDQNVIIPQGDCSISSDKDIQAAVSACPALNECDSNEALNCYNAQILKPDVDGCSLDPSQFSTIFIKKCSANTDTPSNSYCYVKNTSGYDQNKCTVRNKTPVENNVCVMINPLPDCQAITDPIEAEGFATWPQAAVGGKSQGICKDGYKPKSTDKDAMMRICSMDAIDPDSAIRPTQGVFEAIDDNLTCTLDGPSCQTKIHFNLTDIEKTHQYQDNSGTFTLKAQHEASNELQLQIDDISSFSSLQIVFSDNVQVLTINNSYLYKPLNCLLSDYDLSPYTQDLIPGYSSSSSNTLDLLDLQYQTTNSIKFFVLNAGVDDFTIKVNYTCKE